MVYVAPPPSGIGQLFHFVMSGASWMHRAYRAVRFGF